MAAQALNPSIGTTGANLRDTTVTRERSSAVLPKEKQIFTQAYQTLHVAFVIAPLVAGLDKFFNLLTDWEKYLSPVATQVTGLSAVTFMHVVGVVEIIAAIGVAWKPKIFGYVVAIWLAAIIVNLLMVGAYFDVALRDLGLLLSAFAFGRLAMIHEAHRV